MRINFNSAWWLCPYKLFVFFIVPLYIILYFFGDHFSLIRGGIFFDVTYFILGLIFLICFVLSSYLTTRLYNRFYKKYVRLNKNFGYLDFLAITTIIAYGIWFGNTILNPDLFLQIIFLTKDAVYNFRDINKTIPGLTTLSQLGVVYVVFYLNYKLEYPRIGIKYKLYYFIIIILTLFRTVAWSERLAFIEICLPIIVFYVRKIKGKSIMVMLGPYLGMIALIIFFGLSEFLRSWVNGYSEQNISYLEFVYSRIVTYYYTALNNGAGLLSLYNWPTWNFEYIMDWVYKFPFLGDWLNTLIVHEQPFFLEYYADPEFTNMSGIFVVFYDIGITGACILASIWGFYSTKWYIEFKRHSGIGIILYPLFYISLLEVMRIFYLGLSRAFPIFVFSCIGYSIMFSKTEKE